MLCVARDGSAVLRTQVKQPGYPAFFQIVNLYHGYYHAARTRPDEVSR
jgi:hypothetical protein